MGLFNGLWLVVLGVLGAATLIIAKKPDARALVDKLAPYQGWMGAVSALWGVWVIISQILHLAWLTAAPILWLTYTLTGTVLLLLGFLLGVGILKSFVKDAGATAKMDRTLTKLAPYQGTLGLVAIGLGIWTVIAGFLFAIA